MTNFSQKLSAHNKTRTHRMHANSFFVQNQNTSVVFISALSICFYRWLYNFRRFFFFSRVEQISVKLSRALVSGNSKQFLLPSLSVFFIQICRINGNHYDLHFKP